MGFDSLFRVHLIAPLCLMLHNAEQFCVLYSKRQFLLTGSITAYVNRVFNTDFLCYFSCIAFPVMESKELLQIFPTVSYKAVVFASYIGLFWVLLLFTISLIPLPAPVILTKGKGLLTYSNVSQRRRGNKTKQ